MTVRPWLAGALVIWLLVACSGGETTDPREALEAFASTIESQDVDGTLDLFSDDARWIIGNTEIRLDRPLSDDMAWVQQVLGLADDADGRDVLRGYVEYLTVTEADIELSECAESDADLVTCRMTIRDRMTDVSGIQESGTVSVTTEGDRIDGLTVDTAPSGEPLPEYDAFRRWAAINSPAPTEDPGFVEQAARRVALFDEWERAGRPDVPPSVIDDDPVRIVESWLQARNSGDWDTLVGLTGGEALDDPFASRAEFEAAQLLNRDISPRVCSVTASGSTGDFVACDVVVTDIIVDAARTQSTNLNDSTFRVMNGRVIDVPGWIPSSYLAEQAIEQWAEDALPDAYRTACPDGIAGQSLIDGFECARFIAGHRDEWAPVVAELGLGD